MIDFDDVKRDIANSLAVMNPEKVILFGSYAYGTPNNDSDLDICVVESSFVSKWEEKKKIRALLEHIHMPKDIVVAGHDEYEFYKNQINSVFSDIDRKGVLLWQKNF